MTVFFSPIHCDQRTATSDQRPANCELRTANCELRTADCNLRTADCNLRTANCELRTANCELLTADCGLRTANSNLRTANSLDERKASGFSLIEVLVATALLVMIVGMIGFVFRQSSMSWDSGIRRAEGIAQVRAVAGAIERDLRLAVDAREFGLTQSFSDGALKFVILADRDETSQKQKRDRALMQIEYNSGKTVKRVATRLMRSSGSWGPKGTAKTSTLMSPSDSSASTSPEISFEIMPDDNDKNGLPIYVSVYADIRVNESFSGLEVRSYGPNGKKNAGGKSDGDDIVVK